MDRGVAVGVARLENRVRELRLVRGVRIMLRFKAERRMLFIDVPVAARGSVEPVAGIELDARFGRFDLHGTTGFRIFRERAEAHFARFLIGKDEAVVVTAAEVLFRNAGDVFADRFRGGEIERGALNGFDFARRNERVVGRQIAGAVERQDGVENRAGVRAAKIPERVVRKVDRGRLVGRRGIVDRERVVVLERVDDGNVEFARIALVAVRRRIFERQVCAVIVRAAARLPNLLVETFETAVKRIRRVVRRDRIFFSVDLKLAFRDTVAVAANKGAEERANRLIFADRRIIAGNVRETPFLSGTFIS